MKIEFSSHAIDRIKSRKIKKTDIFRTITSPDHTSGSYRSRKLSVKRFNDKMLEVVTIKENSKVLVITAYYSNED